MSQTENVPQVKKIAQDAMDKGGEKFTGRLSDLTFLNYIERLVARILTEDECDAALEIKSAHAARPSA